MQSVAIVSSLGIDVRALVAAKTPADYKILLVRDLSGRWAYRYPDRVHEVVSSCDESVPRSIM